MTALIKEDVESIIEEYIHERLLNYDVIKEELRQLKTGEMVLIPANREHAENMVKMGQFYLDQTNESKS